MKKSVVSLFAGIVALAAVQSIKAQTIASWTFETSQPGVVTTPAAPGAGVAFTSFSPEVGSGTATSLHAGAATYSSPAGNGSAHSFSANTWAVGDYFQFQVSTIGFSGISLSYDQTGSGTGPSTFNLTYSTDGVTFNPISTGYTILVNAAPNTPWSTSTYNAAYTLTDNMGSLIDNQATVYFRIADANTTSLGGGTVAAGGTDRIDNFTVFVTPVPEPSTIALAGIGGVAALLALRRRK